MSQDKARAVRSRADPELATEVMAQCDCAAEAALVCDGIDGQRGAFQYSRARSTRAKISQSAGLMPVACLKWRMKLRSLIAAIAASSAIG